MRVLFELGSQGVHEDGDSVLTWFPPTVTTAEVGAALGAAGFDGPVEYSSAEPVNWAERWKDFVKAQTIGDLRVCPPWLVRDDGPEKFTVVIDPAMAFGTGDHASTRCALRLLRTHVATGDRVADLGTGSGILAIAAAKLGASHVVGIDNDPDAMGNAHENVARNAVDERVILIEGDAASILPLVSPFNLVAANIVSSVLIALLGDIEKALAEDGEAILSGILTDERAEFEGVLQSHAWTVVDDCVEDTWCALAITPR